MAVAIQQPTGNDDALTKIVKGLAVAQSVLGIKQNLDQSALQKKKLEDEKAGLLSPTQRLAFGANYKEVDPSTPGAIGGFSDSSGNQLAFVPRKAEMSPYESAQISLKERELAQKGNEAVKQNFARASELHGKYVGESKGSFEALQGFKKVEAAATKKNPTGADDIALVYGYMKAIDPTSSVKEGEYNETQKTAAIPDQVWTLYKNLIDNKSNRLSDAARQDLYHSALNQVHSVLDFQRQTDDYYTKVASDEGLKLDHVIDPRYQKAFQDVQSKITELKGPERDQFGFVMGQVQTKNGTAYKYIGNDQWEEVSTQHARK